MLDVCTDGMGLTIPISIYLMGNKGRSDVDGFSVFLCHRLYTILVFRELKRYPSYLGMVGFT